MVCEKRFLVLMFFAGAAACGGGGAGSSDGVPPARVLTGSFIDAPVEGLSYETPSKSGVTDSDGSFTYGEGERVRFSFGGVDLGGARGQGIVTPLDLYPDQPAHQNALMSFLQTLDADSYLPNGIELSERADSQLMEIVREQPSADTFPELVARPDFPDMAGRMTSRAEWIDDQEALDAFNSEIEPFVRSGSYRRPSGNESGSGVCPQQPTLRLANLADGPFVDCGPTTSTRIPTPTRIPHGFGGTYPDDPSGMDGQTVCVLPGWDDGMSWAYPNLPDVPIHSSDQIYYNTSASFGVITFTGERVVWRDVNGGRSAGYVCGTGARNIDFNETCVCP